MHYVILFSECTEVRLVESKYLDKLRLGYRCVFTEPGNPAWLDIQWFVNGVNVKYHQSQFDIRNSNTWDGVKSISELWIKNPVALRGILK